MAPISCCPWGHFHFIDGCCLHSSIAIYMQSPSCCQRLEPAASVGQLHVAPLSLCSYRPSLEERGRNFEAVIIH